MRVLGALAVAVLAIVGILIAALRGDLPPWVDAVEQSVVLTAVGAAIGATVSALVLFGLVRFRLGRLVSAAERIAHGDFTINVAPRGGGLEARFAAAVNRIAESMADTYDRATVDRLTGVFNRQALLAELFAEVERASRYDRPLSVAFLDIDHFKVVNDSYGHEAGDLVLRGVAQILSGNVRASDIVGRYGGEEFMLILTETEVEEAAALAEKLRLLVERERFDVDGNPSLTVSASIGVVGGVGTQLRMETLVRDADAAMYSAKSLGRNQVYVFAEPDEEARVPRAPISAAGRARAVEIGREARTAATDYLISAIAGLPPHHGRPSAIIASIVVAMARRLQLPEPEVDRLRIAALIHDVGKIAVPNEILDKPAELTTTEWRAVVQHPRIGQVILEQAAAFKDAVPIVLHHHERFAGHGYPFGLRAAEIPLGARIVAIADAYDAMVHDRPYRPAMRHDQAIEELRRHAGTQFDPELVGVFCDLFASRAPVADPDVVAMIGERRQERSLERRSADSVGARARAPQAPTASTTPSGTLGPAAQVRVDLGGAGQTQPSSEGKGRVAG
jgi:diguanylate cyclase (GGDEF)-like protein